MIFLISADSDESFQFIQSKLKEKVGISIQTGTRINYLSFKIIQSEHRISMDQTDNILWMLELYFRPDYKTRWTDTPICTYKKLNWKY